MRELIARDGAVSPADGRRSWREQTTGRCGAGTMAAPRRQATAATPLRCGRWPTRRPRSAGARRSAPCWASSARGGGSLALIVLCGIGRVVAFIGVGVLGALVVGAVRLGRADRWACSSP